jgi:hypothetical protein
MVYGRIETLSVFLLKKKEKKRGKKEKRNLDER